MARKKKFKNTIESVIERFGGKGGDIESESVINDSNMDKKEGYIEIWSDNATAAKVVKRCGKYIQEINESQWGVSIRIDRKGFRGLEYCFKTS